MKITLDWGLTNLSRGRPHNWERNAKQSSFIAKKKTGLNRTNMETHVSYDVHGNHQLRKKEDDFQNWISQILRTNSMSHQFITHRIHFFILCFQHDECHYIFTMLIWKIENPSWVFSSIHSSHGRCVKLYWFS